MTQAVATSCSAGKLGTCECDKTVKGEGRGWSWGGCSDNALYGAVFTADFMDSRERGTDIKSLMNLHNNRAGRLVRKQALCNFYTTTEPLRGAKHKSNTFHRIFTRSENRN